MYKKRSTKGMFGTGGKESIKPVLTLLGQDDTISQVRSGQRKNTVGYQ